MKKSFTLVEMIVAMAVSTIIIGATYASYDLVATQYKKNIDVAEMHTSGRAVMQMIERDVRMAGFEYRDKDAKVTYGSITGPLVIKDSGNKCCDEVAVIYDYYDEDSKKVDRIRITYSAGPHPRNQGGGDKYDRYRLYKQIDVLGRNNAILANPIIGSKDLLADFVEDLQIVSVITDTKLYVTGHGSNIIKVYDPATNKEIHPSISADGRSSTPTLAFGPNGLLYIQDESRPLMTYNPTTKNKRQKIIKLKYGNWPSMAFGPNGLLYIAHHGSDKVRIYDPATNKEIHPSISNTSGRGTPEITFGPDGFLYIINDNGRLTSYDPTTKKSKSLRQIDTGNWPSMAFGPDGLLYVTGHGSSIIKVYDPATNKEVFPYISNTSGTGTPEITFGPDGFLYIINDNGRLTSYDPTTKKSKSLRQIRTGNWPSMAIRIKRTGQESLVTINLTLRTRNPYGINKEFKKKDYHGGNFKFDKTDKYKRDTFSSKVLVRNMAL